MVGGVFEVLSSSFRPHPDCCTSWSSSRVGCRSTSGRAGTVSCWWSSCRPSCWNACCCAWCCESSRNSCQFRGSGSQSRTWIDCWTRRTPTDNEEASDCKSPLRQYWHLVPRPVQSQDSGNSKIFCLVRTSLHSWLRSLPSLGTADSDSYQCWQTFFCCESQWPSMRRAGAQVQNEKKREWSSCKEIH